MFVLFYFYLESIVLVLFLIANLWPHNRGKSKYAVLSKKKKAKLFVLGSKVNPF